MISKNGKRGNITLDGLARMVQKGFWGMTREMNNRFDGVEGRLDKVEGRLDGVEGRLDKVEGRLDGVEGRLINIEFDVAYLKQRMSEVQRALDCYEELLEEHSAELKWIHKKIDEYTDPRSKKRMITYNEFAKLEFRVASIERKITEKTRS